MNIYSGALMCTDAPAVKTNPAIPIVIHEYEKCEPAVHDQKPRVLTGLWFEEYPLKDQF